MGTHLLFLNNRHGAFGIRPTKANFARSPVDLTYRPQHGDENIVYKG